MVLQELYGASHFSLKHGEKGTSVYHVHQTGGLEVWV